MANMSGIEDYLMEDDMLQPNIATDDGVNWYPAIYCDSIYNPSPIIQIRDRDAESGEEKDMYDRYLKC